MESGFFNSNIIGSDIYGRPIFDRAKEASFFAMYFSQFVGNGVYANPSSSCLVQADGTTLVLTIGAGCCFIKGYIGQVTSSTPDTLTITNGGSNPRIDRIVLRLNLTDRQIIPAVKQGAEADTPVAPDLQRDDLIFELGIADVLVPINATAILAENVTDTRLNNDLCGLVTGLIDQVDTTDLFNQYQAALTNFISSSQTTFQAFIDSLPPQFQTFLDNKNQEFYNWFTNLNQMLTGSNLQEVIDHIDEFLESGTGFFKPKSLYKDPDTNVWSIIDYNSSEWLPNYILMYGAQLPTGTDTQIALQVATDPTTAASDVINLYVNTEGTWGEAIPLNISAGWFFTIYNSDESYFWLGSNWEELNTGIDLSQYRTAAQQDAINSTLQTTLQSEIDLKLDSSNLAAALAALPTE